MKPPCLLLQKVPEIWVLLLASLPEKDDRVSLRIDTS